jgi:hypothetical protein
MSKLDLARLPFLVRLAVRLGLLRPLPVPVRRDPPRPPRR